nr:nucleotide-diphospho-sugar transferase [uncultured Bacteroides sp.]
MNSAILFLIFNRPDTTERVFDTIRQAKPERLYVAADGPRVDKDGEKEKCETTRSIINKVDWNCEVKTLFRKNNLGCGKAVSEAITWFFEHEDEGIILEDDILPHPDFFKYCDELLQLYRYDNRIGVIAGRNHNYGEKASDDSYYFASIAHIWGWATWKRAWNLYDFTLDGINYSAFRRSLRYYYSNVEFRNYWKWNFHTMKNNLVDTWDYQLNISLMTNRCLNIVPNTNLVWNIGFREDATHTFSDTDERVKEYRGSNICPLTHPNEIRLCSKGDTLDFTLNGRKMKTRRYIKAKAKLTIKQFGRRLKTKFFSDPHTIKITDL